MDIIVKTDDSVELSMSRDQFDTLVRILEHELREDIATHTERNEVIAWLTNDENYSYELVSEVYDATASFINALMMHYSDLTKSGSVDEKVIRQIIANAALEEQ